MNSETSREARTGNPPGAWLILTDQLEAVGVGRDIELSVKRNDQAVTVRVEVEDVGRPS